MAASRMEAAPGRDVTIRAAWSPGEVRIAATSGDALLDYALWRPGSPDGVGDVYWGRVAAIVPAMAGAFIALTAGPSGRGGASEAFLPDSGGATGGAKRLTEGEMLIVRVVRAAQGGKGPRVSARVDWTESGLAEKTLGLVRRGVDPLREMAARYPDAGVLVDDPALAASLRPQFGERLTRVSLAFDDAIEAEVDALASPHVALASGVRMSIHPTPALVAIDVDGAGALVGRDTAARRHFTLNASIVPEVARQIRLRNLAGAILVDFAGMKAKQRASLGAALAAALTADPSRPRFLGFTALGLAEIARPRTRAPLHEAMAGPLAAGLVALRAIARASCAEPGRRLTLRAAPPVIAALEADTVALADLARVTGQGLNTRSDPSISADGWHIEAVNG
jgi:Ribonuclease G/E